MATNEFNLIFDTHKKLTSIFSVNLKYEKVGENELCSLETKYLGNLLIIKYNEKIAILIYNYNKLVIHHSVVSLLQFLSKEHKNLFISSLRDYNLYHAYHNFKDLSIPISWLDFKKEFDSSDLESLNRFLTFKIKEKNNEELNYELNKNYHGLIHKLGNSIMARSFLLNQSMHFAMVVFGNASLMNISDLLFLLIQDKEKKEGSHFKEIYLKPIRKELTSILTTLLDKKPIILLKAQLIPMNFYYCFSSI